MKTLQRHEMPKLKVWKTGSSLVITLPKNLAELYNINEGDVLDFIAESKDEFSIRPVKKAKQ